MVHAVVIGYHKMRGMVVLEDLIGVGELVVIGETLIALAPAKQEAVGQVAG